MTAPVLAVDDLHVSYAKSQVVKGAGVTVGPGEVVALVGRNGMGKTTFLNAVAGLRNVRQGTVHLAGIDVTGWDATRRARSGIRLVPQGRRIFPSLTVQENLEVAERKGGRWTTQGIFEMFPRLAERSANSGHALSGGEQQLLAIGRALVGDPQVLLLDEPTEGLAPIIVAELARVLAELAADGLAILLVEQHLAFVFELAGSVVVMENGRIVLEVDDLAGEDQQALVYERLGV